MTANDKQVVLLRFALGLPLRRSSQSKVNEQQVRLLRKEVPRKRPTRTLAQQLRRSTPATWIVL